MNVYGMELSRSDRLRLKMEVMSSYDVSYHDGPPASESPSPSMTELLPMPPTMSPPCPAAPLPQPIRVPGGRLKPIPPPLILQNEVNNLLTEFAIIATSPRSPLMQKNLPIRKRAYSCSSMESIQSYSQHPLTPPPGILSPSPSQTSSSLNSSMEDMEPRTSSSSPYPVFAATSSVHRMCSSGELLEVGDDRRAVVAPSNGVLRPNQFCPVPIWSCFLKGTRIRFVDPSSSAFNSTWYEAEELELRETLTAKTGCEPGESESFASDGLRFLQALDVQPSGVVRLRFRRCGAVGRLINGIPAPQCDHHIEVECVPHHPFYAKEKGWCSPRPELTTLCYGISCRPLEVGDVCLPPTHPDAYLTSSIIERIKSFDFTPEDTSAVLALSSMAKHKQVQSPANVVLTMSPPASPMKKCGGAIENCNKPKRPMNGFMLFAKQHRVEYTHSHPGKDNRAISVLLGDTWKKMEAEERDVYCQQARLLAEEQKKLFPDCWKRRRSLSTSS